MAVVTLDVPRVFKEPPQVKEALATEDIPKVLEVLKEPSHIDQSKS